MGLDVDLYKKRHVSYDNCKTWEEERDVVFSAGITHNLNKMAEKAGLYKVLWRPEEVGAKTAKDIIYALDFGLKELRSNPDYYKKFNPENGWGNYDILVSFVERYLNACIENPNLEISVSR